MGPLHSQSNDSIRDQEPACLWPGSQHGFPAASADQRSVCQHKQSRQHLDVLQQQAGHRCNSFFLAIHCPRSSCLGPISCAGEFACCMTIFARSFSVLLDLDLISNMQKVFKVGVLLFGCTCKWYITPCLACLLCRCLLHLTKLLCYHAYLIPHLMEHQCVGLWLADKASLLLQMTKNPFTSQLLNASELMRGLSPAMVRQVLPLLDQLTPIYTDLAQGRLEFTPEPEETKRLIRTFYGELLHSQSECHCSVCAITH